MIAVVHLVWGPLGPEPVRSFISSYAANPAGAEHRLVILLNGVDPGARRELDTVLAAVEHETLEIPRPMQDVAAYRWAAEQLDSPRICLLGSYSELLAPDWLAKLALALSRPGAGVVGATGSWASLRSLALSQAHLPTPYHSVLPPAREVRSLMAEIDAAARARGARDVPASEPAPARLLRRSVDFARGTLQQARRFDGFPTPHIRTTGLLVERDRLLDAHTTAIAGKMDAYAFESGRGGLTARLAALGLRPLVVDRDGEVHESGRWPASETFWRRGQRGLLIADNQTRTYEHGSPRMRAMLSALAWGPEADAGASG